MIVRWILFETWLGEILLRSLERRLGLAVVQGEWLAEQNAGQPTAMTEVR
jgi:hypothetical protein